MIVGVTGHRPPKVGLTWDHDGTVDRAVVALFRQTFVGLDAALVITGGALGADTLAARAAFLEGIPYLVAVPCRGHSSRWPQPARDRYDAMLSHAAQVVLVTDAPYSARLMQLRNEWMVDRSDRMVALWDGSGGGTRNCILYAERVGVPVHDIYPELVAPLQ